MAKSEQLRRLVRFAAAAAGLLTLAAGCIVRDATAQTLNRGRDNAVYAQDYGVKADGISDDAPALSRAISAAAKANAQTGSPARATLLLPPGVIVCKSTVTFLPFINYLGMRATTADTAPGSFAASRGTIIRADPTLFTSTPDGVGVLVYVPTGDITLRDITFVGTAAVNGNSSIGIQWGSTGGRARTRRPHEVDGAGQAVSGVEMDSCTFYTFTTAWEVNSLKDSKFWNPRFETNTNAIILNGNPANPTASGSDIELHAPVFFASVNGLASATTDVAFRHRVRVFGGEFQLTQKGQTGLAYTSHSSPPGLDISLFGTVLENAGGGAHFINWNGSFTNSESNQQSIKCVGCRFIGVAGVPDITISRGAGQEPPGKWDFLDSEFLNTRLIAKIAQFGKIIGCRFDNTSIEAVECDHATVIGNTFLNNTASAIDLSTPDCGGWLIEGNTFSHVKTPIFVLAHPTNADEYIIGNTGDNSLAPQSIKTLFADLPPSSDFAERACPDCAAGSNPCRGRGTGAIARRLGGKWVCD
jgi:hypothetical protein